MNELFHYYLFLVIFLAFTNNKPPAFGAALAFFFFIISFLGILFCHIPYNLSTILLTANNNLSIPFFYQISGTWSNHEGSILSWCRIPSFYGFLICYRCPPKIHHNVSELRILNFYLFLYYRQSTKIQLFYTPFLPSSSFNKKSIYVNNIRYQKVFYHLIKVSLHLKKTTILNHKYIIYQFLSERKSLQSLPNKVVSLFLRSFNQISESIIKKINRSISSFNKNKLVSIYNPLLIFNKYLKNKTVFSIVLPIIVVATNSYEYVLVINSEERSRGFYRPAFFRLFTTQKKNNTREGYLYFLRGIFLYSLYSEGFKKRIYFLKGTPTHTTLLLLMAREGKEIIISYIEQRIFGLGIALFFSFFLSASPDPFIRNFFVRTEPLSELNPVPQDPLSAIHPPFIYAGEVASAMGFVLCRSKMMTGIVILHSPPIRNNTLTNKGTLLCSAGCVESSLIIRSELLFFIEFSSRQHVVGSMLSRIFIIYNRLCNSLRPRIVLVVLALDDGREQGKLFGLNTVVSVQREVVKIWILICRWFLTVGILPGSWWAYHELGRGGWWFRDPVENASFMPRVLATALLHSVIIPMLNSWTSRMNLVTFLCCILGTFLIRSGLLASVHSFATTTLGIFLWWFFLIMTGISIILFSHMKQQASVHITYKKEMILA